MVEILFICVEIVRGGLKIVVCNVDRSIIFYEFTLFEKCTMVENETH